MLLHLSKNKFESFVYFSMFWNSLNNTGINVLLKDMKQSRPDIFISGQQV